MENESTSTWAFLNKSGEIVNVEADLGSGSESSIEFIRDETVHYERNNNHRSSAEPEVKEDSQDVAATTTSSEILGLDGATATSSEILSSDGATAADDDGGVVTAVKDEEGGGEISRSELTLENITSTDANASVSPNSTSPVSPSSSDDSSGSVTLLEGRFSDGDLDTFPEDFWFDSDFELLDQHSSSDLAHLQLAAGVANNTSPATHRPKFNFKLKKQVPLFSGMGISETETETESVNVSDADDESSTNVELCSSIEESEVASIGPVDEIPPVKNLASLAPVPPHLPVPTLALKPPRMSVTFLMLASLVIGLLMGITTKYSLDPYSSEQLSEDIAEMQRINEMHLLKEENDHMRKYVDSLKWRMNSLQNSNKQQLSDELRQVNQLLKGRIDELDHQILAVQHEIFEAKSGVKPPIISETGKQHIPADNLQDVNEPIANNDPELETEISNHVGAASHDDIIQIHSSHEELTLKESQGVHHEEEESQGVQIHSSESQGVQIHSSHDELALEENQGVQINFSPEEEEEGESQGVEIPSSHKELFLEDEESQDSTEQMSSVSLIDIPSNDAPSINTDDEIIKSESKADETFIALQTKLEEEKKRADNLEKLYAELKQLVDGRKQASESSVETVEGAKAKRAKETVRYCSPLDKDCTMDWLNQEVMLHLITSVMAEIPPQAQQWKEYMAQKFQSVLDPQVEQDPNMKADESEMDSNFQFKKLNVYMNRMLDQMNKAKDDLQTRFEKTLLKIKKGTSKFWEKAVERNEKEMKKSAGRKNGEDLADIEDSESSQDSNLQLIENSIEDTNEEYEIQKTKTFGLLQKGELENDDEVKIRSNENKKHHHHRSDERKKNKDKKRSENKDKKHKNKFDKKNDPEKSDEEKKYQSAAKSQSEEKKHQEKSDGDDKKHRQYKSDNKDKKRKYDDDDDEEEEHHPSKFHDDDDDDIKHKPHKSDDKKKYKAQKLDNEDKKRRYKDDDEDDKKHRPHNDDDDDESSKNKKHKSHRSNDKKNQLKKNKHQHKIDDNKMSKKKLQLNENEKNDDTTKKSKKKLRRNEKKIDDTEKSKKKLRSNKKESDDTRKSKKKPRPNKKESDDTTKSKKRQRKEKKIDDTTKSPKKFRHNEKKLRPTTKSARYAKENRKANEYRDNKKSLKDQRKLKIDKKSKDNFKMKAQSKESCDQLAVNLEDSISTISKEKFRRMNVKTILRMSKKLSNFNKQCKHFSSNTVKEWSACQQMWWTLCGQRGFLPGQLQNSKCQHCLLGWQLLAAASPDGGGKSGCDDCGCQNKPGKQKGDRQDATDSDSAFENIKEEEKKVMSGEWYFKHKTVPTEKSGEWYFKHKTVPAEKNNEQDCDENKFQCSTADLWDEMENEKRQHMDKMLNAEFHRLNHYNDVHRRRCRDYNNHINCYNWFHPTYVRKWASVYYQNLMNIMQKWQK